MTIAFVTLGCKVNQYETEALRRILEDAGHTAVAEAADADAVVVNTCAVTGESARKSRQAIRRARRECPNGKLVVCGCFAESDRDTVKELGADAVFGARKRMQVIEYLLNNAEDIEKIPHRLQFEELPAGAYSEHTRAYLKVQDGCDNFCTYCIIPYLRGRCRSLSPERSAELAIGLAERGFREIVLTGIELSSYGVDLDGELNLADLVESVAAAVPDVRIRLGSLEPSAMTEDVIDRLAMIENLCPHFHLALQSGSAGVLSRMKRKYTPEEFITVVERLRERFELPAITTDVIAGFPGESEIEQLECEDFIRRAGFSAIHVFPYSRREGTVASSMSGELSRSEKESRVHRISEVAAESRKAYLDAQIGRVLELLVEDEDAQSGHTENYLELRIESGEQDKRISRGSAASVKVVGCVDGVLVGKLV